MFLYYSFSRVLAIIALILTRQDSINTLKNIFLFSMKEINYEGLN